MQQFNPRRHRFSFSIRFIIVAHIRDSSWMRRYPSSILISTVDGSTREAASARIIAGDVVVLTKSEAACVGTCLYGFSFWVEYTVALGGPLNTRRTRERIDRRLRLLKQFHDLKEVGSPFMVLCSVRIKVHTVVDASRR